MNSSDFYTSSTNYRIYNYSSGSATSTNYITSSYSASQTTTYTKYSGNGSMALGDETKTSLATFGTNPSIVVGSGSASTNCTTAFWIYRTNNSYQGQWILSQGVFLLFSGTNLIWGDNTTIYSSFPYNTWVHIAVINTASANTCYINGSLASTGATSYKLFTLSSGNFSDSTITNSSSSYICELLGFSRVLSSSEILALATNDYSYGVVNLALTT
jgi:hypothetical protein